MCTCVCACLCVYNCLNAQVSVVKTIFCCFDDKVNVFRLVCQAVYSIFYSYKYLIFVLIFFHSRLWSHEDGG